MSESSKSPQSNAVGMSSLALGILSVSLVFGLGLCALVGRQQGWIRWLATALYVCGASSAFLGFLAAALGLGGLFGTNRARAPAIAGLVLGLSGLCLFVVVLFTLGRGTGP